ncbi:hypothetical protein [Streptomyces sp. NPDC005799]|uniref:hypothetical protein n=1 Tax=Streptomyces sp. NPDC005799 TaxID=3154678 RepID=UPI0033C47B43
MTRRAWLPHPARTVGQSRPCSTGLPRFTNLDRAREARIHGHGNHQLTAWACHQCGGAHITDQTDAPPSAGDCEPAWTTPSSAVNTVTVQENYL